MKTKTKYNGSNERPRYDWHIWNTGEIDKNLKSDAKNPEVLEFPRNKYEVLITDALEEWFLKEKADFAYDALIPMNGTDPVDIVEDFVEEKLIDYQRLFNKYRKNSKVSTELDGVSLKLDQILSFGGESRLAIFLKQVAEAWENANLETLIDGKPSSYPGLLRHHLLETFYDYIDTKRSLRPPSPVGDGSEVKTLREVIDGVVQERWSVFQQKPEIKAKMLEFKGDGKTQGDKMIETMASRKFLGRLFFRISMLLDIATSMAGFDNVTVFENVFLKWTVLTVLSLVFAFAELIESLFEGLKDDFVDMRHELLYLESGLTQSEAKKLERLLGTFVWPWFCRGTTKKVDRKVLRAIKKHTRSIFWADVGRLSAIFIWVSNIFVTALGLAIFMAADTANLLVSYLEAVLEGSTPPVINLLDIMSMVTFLIVSLMFTAIQKQYFGLLAKLHEQTKEGN